MLGKKSLKYSAKLDESNAETIPNNNIIEIDLGINSLATDSDAANRYWWIKACELPIKKLPNAKIKKFYK